MAFLAIPALLLGVPVAAESQTPTTLNPGFNDAWYNAATSGQGFVIAVLPEKKSMFVAWFTYDTERPPEDTTALLGEPGHRWLTAQGGYEGMTANLTLFLTEGGVFAANDPPATTNQVGYGTMTIEFADCAEGLVTYEIPSLGLQETIPIARIVSDNLALCQMLSEQDPQTCTRPPSDDSHGSNDPEVVQDAIIDRSQLLDGGPGPDGIPPLERPRFGQTTSNNLTNSTLVVGVKIGNDVRAYPHNILNWHEVVNDQFEIEGRLRAATLNYCPLTGSAMLWRSLDLDEPGNPTWGTSGLLYNSNLVMYDRNTLSLWSQMLEQAVVGSQVTKIPQRLQVVETTWGTWKEMYPQSKVLSERTGFSRDYSRYPYGSFRTNNNLLFPVNNDDDLRLHRKERVVGINVGDFSKVYPISRFSLGVEVINETVGGMDVVVVGSRDRNFGVVYNRELADCSVLDFEAVQNRLPIVMRDQEGGEWDVFGVAVSGPHQGEQLEKTNSYIAYWYAWTAFFPGAEIR